MDGLADAVGMVSEFKQEMRCLKFYGEIFIDKILWH
jgi:hypothetical protein